MRHYETIFIINPDLSEEETAAVKEKFQGILETGGAVMANLEDWGRRRLAYRVKKFNKGYYMLFDYGSGPEAVTELERNFKIDERVIRFLTVQLSDSFDAEEQAAARARAEARKQAELQSAQEEEEEPSQPQQRDEDEQEDEQTDAGEDDDSDQDQDQD